MAGAAIWIWAIGLSGLTEAGAAKPGDPDPGFGKGGRISIAVDSPHDTVVRDMIRTPDGKLIVAGGSDLTGNGVLLRLLPDGRRDRTFGGGDGIALTPESLWAKVELQGEGILAYGRSGSDPAVARFDSNGGLDESFGSKGIVRPDVRSDFRNSADAIIETPGPGTDSEGRIVAASFPGSCQVKGDEIPDPDGGEWVCRNVILHRYLPDGEPDLTYGDAGALTIHAGTDEGPRPSAVALDQEDRILVRTTPSHYYEDEDPAHDILQRFLENGELDPSFNRTGTVSLGYFGDAVAALNRGRILVSPDGTISVLSRSVNRFNSDGTPIRGELVDRSDILWLADVGSLFAYDIEQDDKGRTVLVGSAAWDGKRLIVTARFETDGRLDGTWSGNAISTSPIGTSLPKRITDRRRGSVETVSVLDPDGGVTVAATGVRGGELRFEVARFRGGDGEHQFCEGRRATVLGTPGDDEISIAPRTVVNAGAGDDTITGASGSLVCLGSGNDRLIAPGAGLGPDRTRVLGSTGRDSIQIGKGRIESGPGNDEIKAGRGPNLVFAGAGDDRIETRGTGRFHGGPGDDVIRARKTTGKTHQFGEGGRDRLYGGDGRDRLDGGPGADRLFGGKRSDLLRGGPGRDALHGGPSSDRLIGGPGLDLLDPGPSLPKRQVYRVRNRVARGTVWMNGDRMTSGMVSVWNRCSGYNYGPVTDGFQYAPGFDAGLKFNGKGKASVRYDDSDGWGLSSSGWMRARKTPKRIHATFFGRDDFSYGEDGAFKCRTGVVRFTLKRIPQPKDVVRQ